MGKIEKSVEYSAGPDKLWAVVTDLPRWGEWFTIHQSWKDEPPTELTRGATLRSVVSVLNMPNTIIWNVDDYTAGSSVSISGTGMAGAKLSVTMTISPSDAGSRLTIESTFEGQMTVGAIGAAIERAGLADLETSLNNLEALVS